MQEKYTLNTALAAVVGLGCLAAVLYRVFLPAAVLPAVGIILLMESDGNLRK